MWKEGRAGQNNLPGRADCDSLSSLAMCRQDSHEQSLGLAHFVSLLCFCILAQLCVPGQVSKPLWAYFLIYK